MANNVVFEDYSVNVKNLIKEKAIKFLYEVGGEIRSRASRNQEAGRPSSQTAGSYKYKVDEEKLCVHIGSNYQNAIWEEFGTGEYALHGDGRKGYWVYVKGSSGGSSTGSKTYTLKEAKRAMAFLRSKGLEAYYTKGKKPKRSLFKAFDSSKDLIEERAKQIFGELD